jgi:hypothetical protein
VHNYVDGLQKKVLPTELGDSFIVVEDDDGKDLEELNIKEYDIIEEQTNLSKAEKTKKYFKKLNNSYGWVCTALGMTRIIVTLLI